MIKKEDIQTILTLVESTIQRENITVYRVEPRDLIGFWDRELRISQDFPYLIVEGNPSEKNVMFGFYYLSVYSDKRRIMTSSGLREFSQPMLELSTRKLFYVDERQSPRCSKIKICLTKSKTASYPKEAFYLEKKIYGRQAFLTDLQEHIMRRHRVRVMRKLMA